MDRLFAAVPCPNFSATQNVDPHSTNTSTTKAHIVRHFLVPAARIRWRIYVHTLPFLPYPHEIMDDLDYLSYTLIDNRLSPYHRGMIRLRRQHLPHAHLVDTRSHLTSLARKSTGTRNDDLCTAATIPRCPILYPLLCLLVTPKMEIDPFFGYLCGVSFASWCLKLCGCDGHWPYCVPHYAPSRLGLSSSASAETFRRCVHR